MAAARLNLPSGLPLRRVDPAGRARRPGHRHRRRVRGGRRPRGRDHRRRGAAARSSESACPTEGSLRRHVHRQHDGVGRPRPSACRCPARRRPPAVDRRRDDFAYAVGRGRRRAARAEHPAPPDHDQGGVRERHRRRHGPRRLHQRRAPPAGHRPRGRGRAGARGLQPGRGPGAAHRRHQAPRQVPHGRPRPGRRRARGHGPPARGRPAPRRLPHGHRQDRGREPGRPRPARARRRRGPPADRPDPRPGRHRRAAGLAGAEGRAW